MTPESPKSDPRYEPWGTIHAFEGTYIVPSKAWRVVLVAGALLAAAGLSPVRAQDAGAGPDRPRTCMVLSGGGARGAAHVGALRVLDELRVPIDCVVGTSMGAVVGGLYATGMDHDDLEREMLAADWRDLFSDRPPRRDIPFRRKADDNLPFFQFEFGLKRSGLVLPGGLVAGQKLDFLLKVLTLPAADVASFDDLAVPFRAVATDLTDGSRVVLDRGNLADAVRASMSVPGAFTPVRLDGRTLVDGGLVANLPVSVAREVFAAERIVAIDVSLPPDEVENERSVVGVAVQTINILTEQNLREERALLGEADVLLRPDLDDLTSTDFERMEEIRAAGERAAREVADRLRSFAVPEEEYARRLEARNAWRDREERPITIESVEVRGMDRVDARIVTRRIRTEPGDVLDVEVLRRDLARVYRLGDFERVEFRVEEYPEVDHSVLAIEVDEKSWGPNFVRFGMSLQSDFSSRGEFTLLGDFTRTRVNSLGAEWKTRATLGEVNSAFTEFYQPLDHGGYWFVAPQGELVRRSVDVFQADGTVDELRVDLLGAGFDLGVQFSNYGELRVGVRRGRVRLKNLSQVDALTRRIDLGAWRASLVLDRLDNANFPRWGNLFGAELVASRDELSADDAYDRLAVEYLDARSFGKNTIVARFLYGTGMGGTVPSYDLFQLGGFLELSGLRPGALSGSELGLAQLIYYRQIGTLPGALGGGLYVGMSAEAGNVWRSRAESDLGDLRPAGLLWTGVDTVFGPIYAGYGRTDDAQDSFYLAVGFPF